MIICALSIFVGVAYPIIFTVLNNKNKEANDGNKSETERSEVVYSGKFTEVHQYWNG